MALLRAEEPKKDSYSAEEVFAGVDGFLGRLAEFRASLPAYDTYEAVDLVTARQRLVSFEVTRHAEGGHLVGFAISHRTEGSLSPHFAEWVARLEAGEDDWV